MPSLILNTHSVCLACTYRCMESVGPAVEVLISDCGDAQFAEIIYLRLRLEEKPTTKATWAAYATKKSRKRTENEIISH